MNQQQKDIIEERGRATFSPKKMAFLLYGGETVVKRHEKVKKRNPALTSPQLFARRSPDVRPTVRSTDLVAFSSFSPI